MTITIHIPPLRHATWGWTAASACCAVVYAAYVIWGHESRLWDFIGCTGFFLTIWAGMEAAAAFLIYQSRQS